MKPFQKKGKHNDSAFKTKVYQEQKANNALKEIYKQQLVISLYTLHKDFGFGNKRLEKFIEEYNKALKCINEDYVTIEDMIQLLKDECKLEVK